MSDGTCDRYNSYIVDNKTSIVISSAYEGIPQNFAINIGAYMILIGLFIFLRKKAWNYGKLSLTNKPIDLLSSSMRREPYNEEAGNTEVVQEKISLNKEEPKTFLEKVYKIIPLFIKMSDEQLYKKCGADAVIYCQFQRLLMMTVVVMMFFSLILILPLNLNGGVFNDSSNFATLTIGNIKYNNSILWVHFSVALTLMLFSFFLSNRFIMRIDTKSKIGINSSIMIKNVPVNWCDELSLKTHFLEAFPSINVQRVQVTYKVDKLILLYTEKLFAEEALEFCYDELEKNGERVMVVPYGCGRIMSCRCCKAERCKPVDGVEYYSTEVLRLSKLFVEEKINAKEKYILPIVFVTFGSAQEALLVRRDYIYQNYCCINKGPSRISSLSKDLKSDQWNVAFAPMAQDIIWQNLHKRGWKWLLPVILANLCVGIIVIMVSTPSMVLNLVRELHITDHLSKLKLSSIIVQVVPSLILVLVNSLMPMLILWSNELSAHWTKTSQNISIMNKLYAVLVTTVLILPSLGLNSISVVIRWVIPRNNSTRPSDPFKWACIFMPDGGALFCNYLISASFIGTAFELLRFGELFLIACKKCCSKSRAEDKTILTKILWEFQYGIGYAWTLAFFSMTSAYTVIVPIITPFGLTYLVLKHMVDRYNMIHVNIPSNIHNSVHINAAQLMQVGLVLTQATVTIYVYLRTETAKGLSICCYIGFSIGILLTFGRTVQRWIMAMSFIKYSNPAQQVDVKDTAPTKDVVTDDEELILMDDFTEGVFIPRELTIEEPVNIDQILSRKSVIAVQTSKESLKQENTPPDYGTC